MPRQHAAKTKTVAVIADPVFDSNDKRVLASIKGRNSAPAPNSLPGELRRALRDVGDVGTGGAGFRLDRLEYSAREAKSITDAAPPGSWMKAMNFQANRATAKSQDLMQYSIVHFATHSILNDRHPELSGMVLSMVNEKGEPQDGYLRLGDIYNLDLPVDLVVLSACRSGIGKPVRGEGLIGLTRGFMYAGAQRIVASLWNVEDEATSELMRRFYRLMLEQKLPASAALRKAKLEMMARVKWHNPYSWAGFVIQGDWK
jgi:CHAT domain-containing protein